MVLFGAVISTGLSLAYNVCLLPSHRHKVTVPGLHLRRHTGTFIEPVRPAAPPLDPVSPGLGGIYTISPLSNFVPVFSAAAGPPLPSRDFYFPLQIAAFNPECR